MDPSSKFHCQEAGEPAEVSVNCTAWPATGEAGLKVKDAVGADEEATVSIWLAVLVPELLLASNVTM